VLTLRAYKHLGLSGPARTSTPQISLFDDHVDEAPDGKAGTG
jgi:Holliday junction DNA helicase RuvB